MALLRLRGMSVRLSPSQYSSLLSQRHNLGQTPSTKGTVLRKMPNEHSINPGGFFSGHFKYSPIRRKSISINIQGCQGENVHWTTLDIGFARIRSYLSHHIYLVQQAVSFYVYQLKTVIVFLLSSPKKCQKNKVSFLTLYIKQWVESRGDGKSNCPHWSILFEKIPTHPYSKADNLHSASRFVPQH